MRSKAKHLFPETRSLRTFAKTFSLLLFVLATATAMFAVTVRGVMVREGVLYLSPDQSSAKLADLGRGRELAILETSHNWLHVFASVGNQRDVTGWIRDLGVVRVNTPNGDQILYGEAVSSEHEASRRGGRKYADKDAFRLYRMTAEYFPGSPLAAEAAYRAADIQWQVERADMLSRPSAKERDPIMHHQINEELMRQVVKKYKGTKWSDLAAFHLIDNQLCGDWQGESKCPEREANIYEKYVAEHPQSPAAPEALYSAATRRAALIDIYKNERQAGKSAEAKTRALSLTQRITSQYAQGDWGPRARSLQYVIEQGIPTYGVAATDLGISDFKP